MENKHPIVEELKKYVLTTTNDYITAGLIPAKVLLKPLKLKPVGYTRVNADLLRNIICRNERIVDVILYETEYLNTPMIRIGDNILAPIVDDNYIKPKEIEIECP